MTRRILMVAALVAMAQRPARGQEPRAPHVVSPEVGHDHRVTFRLYAPRASEVLLTGEMLAGPQPLGKGPDGVWSATIGPLEPEIYHYNLVVDGVRTIDPGNAEVKTGSHASTTGSVLTVPGDHPAFYDGQPVPHGDVRALWYQSKSLGRLRQVLVYTPPGYEGTRARLPVLYLLHGANADETAWYRLGRVNFILDNLLADEDPRQRPRPFVVVMPFGYGVGPDGAGDNTALFAKDLLGDVIPFVEARYRVLKDRDHRAIAGLSMGGGQALRIGLEHRELFGYVAGFSSGLGRPDDFPTTYASLIAHPDASNKQLHLLWIGCGQEDKALAGSRSFSEFLDGHQIRHTFRQSSGAHTWMVWRRYLHELSPLLFR